MKAHPAIRVLFQSCCILLMSAGALPGHVFTNPDGKTFEGNVVNGNEKTVKKSVEMDTPNSRAPKRPPELKLHYMQRQTKRESTGQSNTSIAISGAVEVISIPSIPDFRSTIIPSRSVMSVKTSHVSTETTRLSDGRTQVDQQSSKSKSGLSSISLVIFHKDRKVAQRALIGHGKTNRAIAQARQQPFPCNANIPVIKLSPIGWIRHSQTQ